MTTFLSISLLLIGATSTIAAFGGKTWRDGPEPILERITARGWMSLACLTLAVGLGVWKQLLDTADKTFTEEQHASEIVMNAQTQRDLREQLTKQDGELAGLRGINIEMKKHLQDQGITLNEVRGNLSQTKDDLTQQSAANLVTALAAGNLSVEYLTFVIPISPRAVISEGGEAENVREAFLPTTARSKCGPVTLDVIARTGATHTERLTYDASDIQVSHRHMIGEIPSVDLVSILEGGGLSDYIYGTKKLSAKELDTIYPTHVIFPPPMFELQLKPKVESITAADAYTLYSSDSVPLQIRAFWESTKERTSSACTDAVGRYFRMAFDKAILIVDLDNKQHETIVFHLNAGPPVLRPARKSGRGLWDNPLWNIPFKVAGSPEFVTNQEKRGMIPDWPDAAVK